MKLLKFKKPKFRVKVIHDFWPRAKEARIKFENFVGNPKEHSFESVHQCWDYWYLPNLYNYLRTQPEKIFGTELVEDFLLCLKALPFVKSGNHTVLTPWVSLHLNGMRHELHNDGLNGTYGYVFSLTKNLRNFTGGETCIAKNKAFDVNGSREFKAWTSYFEVIQPQFNQLILFDDRLAHMVPVVQGTMNPTLGRVCLTGHAL